MTLSEMVHRQSRGVMTVVALLCVAGILAAWQLPSAIFPNTDFPRVVIILDNGDVPADQMLATVTRPVEEAMNGIPGIKTIKSKTSRGSS
ncbi:MAG TPA: efflux RND transporter permease subunit, partial [Pyrinomonadaceae bacterium]